jgi:hypothetical protein
MEKIKIEYEKLTEVELLKIWKDDKTEFKNFLHESGLTETEVNKAIEEDEAITILNQIITYAKGCDLHFCYQCNMFVESDVYINNAQQCIKCAIGNGV